jgi:hypothetical protein
LGVFRSARLISVSFDPERSNKGPLESSCQGAHDRATTPNAPKNLYGGIWASTLEVSSWRKLCGSPTPAIEFQKYTSLKDPMVSLWQHGPRPCLGARCTRKFCRIWGVTTQNLFVWYFFKFVWRPVGKQTVFLLPRSLEVPWRRLCAAGLLYFRV